MVADGTKHARHRAQQTEFLGKPAWVQIVFDGLAPSLAFIGRASVDMGKDAPNDLDVIGHQRLRRGNHARSITS
jgi:hypothetical protein